MEGVQFIGGNVPSLIAFGNSNMCSLRICLRFASFAEIENLLL